MFRLGQLFYRLNRGGHLKPINPIRIFPVSKADQALATMQRGTHIGKIVIKVRGGDRSDPVPMKKPKLRFAPEAAYLLVGGLGGLGRAVSNWMVENGARNLVIVSRSGVKSRADRNFIEELRYQGCNAVVVVGNVADINDVNKVIAESPKAISGVIHLGMVLKVRSDLTHISNFTSSLLETSPLHYSKLCMTIGLTCTVPKSRGLGIFIMLSATQSLTSSLFSVQLLAFAEL